jgi:iron complex outermembrane receptor protein
MRYSALRASRTLLTPLAIAVGLASANTAAQQVLEEVIVTAQKREQSLQDVPIAVTSFTGRMLQESGIKDVFDLQSSAPSLTVDQNQNATTSNFSIRGIGTGANNFGLESSVGLYVDGVYRSRQSSMINQLVDIASVEILRGPQGTLFGRNTLSGALQFNTVAADHEGGGFLEATGGNYGLVEVSGAKSFSLIEDVLALRVTGFSSERDGWIDNLNTAGDDEIFDRDRWGWRAQALWTPTDELTIRVIADDAELNEICCGTTVWYDNNREDLRYDDGRLGSDSILEERGGTFIPESRVFENEVAYNFLPESESEDSGVSIQVDYDMGDYTLTSISAWREFNSFDHIDADFTDLDGLEDTNDAEQESLSQELRVAYTGDRLNYVVGGNYYTQDLDSNSRLDLGEDSEALAGFFAGIPLEAIFMGGFFPPDGWANDLNEQEHESWAVFGQFDYLLTDTLTLTAGLRYSDEHKDLTSTYTESGDEPGFSEPAFPATQKRPNVDETINDDQVTGTAKLSWFATEDIMVYASYGTGYKAGGTNTDRISTELTQVFDAETTESWELGMKAEFPEQALRVNLSIYMTDIDDFQVGTFTGAGFNLQNAATVETYGGELEVLWQPTNGLTLTGSYARTVADFDEFPEGNCWETNTFRTGQPDPGASFYNDDGSTRPPGPGDDALFPDACDRADDRIGTNPEDFVYFGARQTFDITDGISGFVMAEYTYTGDMMLNQNNDPLSKQDEYDLVNLRAGVEFEQYGIEATIWGRNVFDEEYNGTSFPGVLQTGKEIAYRREPATYGATLRWTF